MLNCPRFLYHCTYHFKVFEKAFDLLVQKSRENTKESTVDDVLIN
jgi:hypothetical protein